MIEKEEIMKRLIEWAIENPERFEELLKELMEEPDIVE
jgi:hypothetical protein